MVAFNMLQGGSWESPVLGIAVGYLYHYLDSDDFPQMFPGWKMTRSPAFLREMLPDGRIQGLNGPVQMETPANKTESRTSRSSWGKGHRLGST